MSAFPQPLVQAFVVCREISEPHPTADLILTSPFSRVTCPSFPATVPLSVYAHLTDSHGRYQIGLQLVDGDDEIVWLRENICVVEELDPLMPHRLVLRQVGVTFPEPGRYDFVVLANGESLAHHALWARKV